MRGLFLSVAALAALPLCAEPIASLAGLEGFVRVERLPVPDLAILAEGREIWGANCQNCHGGNKLTGAPKITSTEAWAPRIATGLDTLVAHATDGFIGPTYKQMPARGGNSDLSDEAVKAAVAFMVWASGASEDAESWAAQHIEGEDTK